MYFVEIESGCLSIWRQPLLLCNNAIWVKKTMTKSFYCTTMTLG